MDLREGSSHKYGRIVWAKKTTLEIPDAVFRKAKAKAKAAEQGVPLRQFVNEAVEAKLGAPREESKPWMKMIGGLKHLRKETARINKLIAEEFEKIEPEDQQ